MAGEANDVEIVVKVTSSEIQAGLDKIKVSAEEAANGVSNGFNRARDSLGRFTKASEDAAKSSDRVVDANGRLRDSLGRFVKAGEEAKTSSEDLEKTFMRTLIDGIGSAISTIGSLASSIGSTVGPILDKVGSAFGNLGSVIATVGPGALIGAGAFAALSNAILIAGGAAGAAATALSGLVIGLATLKMGFGGIGDALAAHTKLMNQAGGAASNTAEQQYQAAKRIHDAERNLTDAKANELDAIKAVNQARQDEITRLKELDITLEEQTASQADAAQALVEAKEKRRRADIAGSDWEKANARNAVADAQARYDSITFKLKQSTEEKKKSVQVGIDGSDQVQAALKSEATAHENVIKAEEALADAHHQTAQAAAGASAAATAYDQAMANLSPNAQKLVLALIALQDKFHALKMEVQDKLLAGFDVAVTQLADKWLPHLSTILGGTAEHLNGFGKTLIKAFGDSDFIKNMERAGKEGEKVIDKMKPAIAGLVDAFGRLAGHSGPVLQVIVGFVAKIFEWFDKWIKSVDKSGKLDSFMKMAADTLQQIFDIAWKAVGVVMQFVEIIFPSSKKTGDSVFDTLSKDLDKISAWLNDPNNQKWIKAIADSIGELIAWLVKKLLPTIVAVSKAFIWVIKQVGDFIDINVKLFKSISNGLSSAFDWMVNKVTTVFNWLLNASRTVGKYLGGMWEGLRQGLRDVLNWVVDRWNSLHFTLPGILGGGTIGLPPINHFAHGGVASGLISVGEHGRELIRVPTGSTVIPHGQSEAMMAHSGGGGQYTFAFDRTGNKLMDAIIDSLRLYIKSRGGSVQVALGRGNG